MKITEKINLIIKVYRWVVYPFLTFLIIIGYILPNKNLYIIGISYLAGSLIGEGLIWLGDYIQKTAAKERWEELEEEKRREASKIK